MTTPNEQKYRPLGPDEVTQEGDEYRGIGFSKWQQCVFSIGITPKDWPEFEFRRPIPAEPERKEEKERLLGADEIVDFGDYYVTGRGRFPVTNIYAGKRAGIWPYLTFWRPTSVLNEDAIPAEPEPKKVQFLDLLWMNEDELPEGISDDEFSKMFAASKIADGVRKYPYVAIESGNRFLLGRLDNASLDPDKLELERAVSRAIISGLKDELAKANIRIEALERGNPTEQPFTDMPMDRQVVMLNRQLTESEKKRAAAAERVSMLKSAIRDRHETYKFGGEVMNSIVLKRVDKMLPGEIAINALYRWVFERDYFKQRAETAERDAAANLASMNELSRFTTDLEKNQAAERDRLQAELAKCREALQAAHGSASPNPSDHPAMFAAWEKIEAALEGGK